MTAKPLLLGIGKRVVQIEEHLNRGIHEHAEMPNSGLIMHATGIQTYAKAINKLDNNEAQQRSARAVPSRGGYCSSDRTGVIQATKVSARSAPGSRNLQWFRNEKLRGSGTVYAAKTENIRRFSSERASERVRI